MPDYGEAALEAGWIKVGSRWTHPKYPGKIYGNPREIYNEALPAEYKRPLSVDRWVVDEPTVLPQENAPEMEPEWKPGQGTAHPRTVERKWGVAPDEPRRPRGRPPKNAK